MTTRTLPPTFPLVKPTEVNTYRVLKASLIRRLAQAQNYLWANLRRVYANCGYEGLGNTLQHVGTNLTWGPQQNLELMPNGDNALPVCTFLVPQNWAGGTRLKIQGRVTLSNASGSNRAAVYAVLKKLDGSRAPGGAWDADDCNATGANDWLIRLRIPQDDVYVCHMYLSFTSGSAGAEVEATNAAALLFVSARYEEADTSDTQGVTVSDTWTPCANPMDNDRAVASAFLHRLAENTNHLFAYRNPELCQAYLGTHYNNTSTFTEVGRYIIYSPSRCLTIAGKLQVRVSNSGAGNECRVLVDGVVKQTFAALSAGDNTLTVSAITVTDKAEHTITIEAKSTAASAAWGTQVTNVAFYENAPTLALPGGTTVPTDYAPMNEDGLEGDDGIVYQTNSLGERSGLYYLFENDRWLAYNRVRWLIGDARQKIYKRLDIAGSVATVADPNTFDPRVDWTPQFPLANYGLGAPKNITLNGTADDVSPLGPFDKGQGTDPTYSENGPYLYPLAIDHTNNGGIHGRRLAVFHIIRPAGLSTHVGDLGMWKMMLRGRRLRPAQMSTDSNGEGPTPAEPKYAEKAQFIVKHDSTDFTVPILHTNVFDYERSWRAALIHLHTNSDKTVKIRGSLPAQYVQNLTGLEGWYFEVELNAVYLADEPLNSSWLQDLT